MPPSTKTFEGNIRAVVSPFDTGGNLMADAFQTILQWHLDSGAEGLCVAGHNGEPWALTAAERRVLAEATVAAARDRVPVIMGVSAATARQTIANAEIAAEAGADAIMVSPQPYVGRATRAEIVERFEAVHRAVPLPIVVFNSPRHTGIDLNPDTLEAIIAAVDVAGLKESSRDLRHTGEIVERFGHRIAVLMGPAYFIFPGYAMGARGFISTGPELFGADAARFRALATKAPGAESRHFHFALNRLYPALMDLGTPPAGLKAALNLLGLPAGIPREPVNELSSGDTETLRGLMSELKLLDPPLRISRA